MLRVTVPSRPGAYAYSLARLPAYLLPCFPGTHRAVARDLRDEVIDSCEYAYKADHVSSHGGLELLASGTTPRGGGGGGVLVLGATAAVLLAAHRRTVL